MENYLKPIFKTFALHYAKLHPVLNYLQTSFLGFITLYLHSQDCSGPIARVPKLSTCHHLVQNCCVKRKINENFIGRSEIHCTLFLRTFFP